jgi:DNA repair exonuclease SbcCD nuclease subunit
MPGESFRFIHASDFHLEKPLSDLDSFPSQLQDAMAGAPRNAAKAVFEAALVENIDFVVLCGDLISPVAAGPYGMSLLLDYFDKLQAKDTPVFWAAGVADDAAKWPDSVPLPPNVTLFPKDRAISVPVERAGRTICHVIGRSCDGRPTVHVPSYRMDLTDGYTVAVGHGNAEAGVLAEGRFDYWALGGEHNEEEIENAGERGAAYCGSPQGRDLTETGPHGYHIIDVDAEGETRTHSIQCDTFRYCNIEIDATDIASTGNIRNLIGERIVRLQHENGGRHLILGWDITINDGEMLHSIGDTQELLHWVRSEYGHGAPSAWTARMTVRPPSEYPKSWHEEETILGDFLRITAEHRKTDGRELNLLPFTEEHKSLAKTSANLLAEVPPASRKDTLNQATLLGVELLRGGKPNLVQKS